MLVQSIAATGNLGTKVNVFSKFLGTCFKVRAVESRFAKMILKLESPVAMAIVYEGGHFAVLGTKTEEDSLLAANRVVDIVRSNGLHPNACLNRYAICNVVALVDVGTPISVLSIREACSSEKFGLRAHDNDYIEPIYLTCNAVGREEKFLIFPTGFIVSAGATSIEEADRGLKRVVPLTKPFTITGNTPK